MHQIGGRGDRRKGGKDGKDDGEWEEDDWEDWEGEKDYSLRRTSATNLMGNIINYVAF